MVGGEHLVAGGEGAEGERGEDGVDAGGGVRDEREAFGVKGVRQCASLVWSDEKTRLPKPTAAAEQIVQEFPEVRIRGISQPRSAQLCVAAIVAKVNRNVLRDNAKKRPYITPFDDGEQLCAEREQARVVQRLVYWHDFSVRANQP